MTVCIEAIVLVAVSTLIGNKYLRTVIVEMAPVVVGVHCERPAASMPSHRAIEVCQSGITVNCVAPGPTQTGWIDTDLEQSVLPVIPMGKLIQPEDIAETILFLASEQARMLTGQVINVSGGQAS